MLHKESIAFSWVFPEFEYKNKNRKWYYIVGVIALILISIAIVFQNYLFGFLIFIGVFLMFNLATKEPLILEVEISEQGLKINETMHSFSNINAFWIAENTKEQAILLLATNKPIAPVISVVIDEEINILELREYLLDFLEEQEMKEPLSDKIIDKIGF